MTFDEVREAALRLTPEERENLLAAILIRDADWVTPDGTPLTVAVRERVAAVEAGTMSTVDPVESNRRIRAKLAADVDRKAEAA